MSDLRTALKRIAEGGHTAGSAQLIALDALAASATDEGPHTDTPEQTHSAEYNRGWAEGNASALDACNPVIERLQTELAARPAVPEALDLEAIALKAAEIGFTYGALGRDFTFAYKNVQDMLAEIKEGTSD